MILFPSAEYAWKKLKKVKINMEKKNLVSSCSDGFHNGEKCRQPASTSSSLELTNKAL